MKRVLLISNRSIKFTNFIIPPIEVLKNLGYEVHTCANYTGFIDDKSKYDIKMHQIDFIRNPFNPKNIKAYKQLLNLMKDEKFDIVHCNTPIGGLLGRICAKKTKVPKVIYTAHGFHFYKGAPLLNNTILKWIEKIMAHWTDVIITMNKEDYEEAKKFKLKKNGKVYFVHGVGINLGEYKEFEIEDNAKRKELNLEADDIVLISMGDLIKRKNYELALNVIAKCNNEKIKYLICGKGPELNNLKEQAKSLGIEKQVLFLGFRTDIKELLKISDIFLFTSKQEGLPRSLMEAMASGLPCVVSKIRGNVDLIENKKNGFLCNNNNVDEYVKNILYLSTNKPICEQMGKYNLEIIEKYDVKSVKKELAYIYNEILGEKV